MPFKASTLLILAAITCIQCTFAQNIVETTVLNAVDTLNKLFTSAGAKITEQMRTIAIYISDRTKFANTTINNDITNILDQVSKLEKSAASGGKDVSLCTFNVALIFRSIGDSGIEKAIGCSNDTQKLIEETYQQFKNELNKISLLKQKLLDDFKSCQNIFCRGGFVFRAGASSASNTIQIGALVARTLAKLAVNSAQGVSCLATATFDTRSEASKFLNGITDCTSNVEGIPQ